MASTGFAAGYNFTNTLNSMNRDHSLTDYIIDLVFESMKGLDFMRQREMVEEVSGGLAGTWMVNVGKSPNTVWYQGDQDLPIASLNNNVYTALTPKAGVTVTGAYQDVKSLAGEAEYFVGVTDAGEVVLTLPNSPQA